MGRRAKSPKGKADAKRPLARKSAKDKSSRVRDLEKRLAESLEREKATGRALTEALDQQTATSEILRVISSSPGDIQPVFDAIAANAARLCDAVNGLVIRFDGQLLHLAAHHNVDPERLAAVSQAYPRPPSRGALSGRAILTRAVVHVPDVSKDPEYTLPAATTIGYRSVLAVPMMHEGVARGTILVARDVVAPFSDTHIALIQTFADQAVIAIENVRLFNETKEALDRQTATSDILRVISSSPTDVQPVFDAIARNARELLAGHSVSVTRLIGDEVHLMAFNTVNPEGDAVLRAGYPVRLDQWPLAQRTVREGTATFVEDVETHPDTTERTRRVARARGFRSFVWMPMVHDGAMTGWISVTRSEPGPFSESHIALLQTFADQAVIAIENVRLFKELEARNAELTETLTRQIATGEVLRAIGQAQTDAQPVFDIIAGSARRLCKAAYGQVQLYDDELIHLAALESANPEGDQAIRAVYPLRVGDGSAGGRAIGTRAVAQIPDLLDERAYAFRSVWEASGLRSLLAVPMLRDGEPIGAIAVGRPEAGPFPQTQIDLLQTFADQAVIAIENVRLFNELEGRNRDLTESLEQQTATSEILRVISSSPGDIQPVFDAIAAAATTLCAGENCGVFLFDGTLIHFAAHHQWTAKDLEAIRQTFPRPPGPGTVTARAILTRAVAHSVDVAADPAYELRGFVDEGFHAILSVPMLRDGDPIGAISVTRREAVRFSERQIELLETFARQAVIAIENVRLFNELQNSNREIEDKSRQLETASQHKSEFLANMSHELRTPLNAIIGFSEVLTERMFGELNEKQDEYLKDIYASGQHLLSLINDILDLSKIEAGRMELEATDFDLPSAIDNALTLVRERAGRRGIMLGREIDERVGTIRADERKVKQVLLNLLSNALKFTLEGGRIDVRAAVDEGLVEVSVVDTGVGIAPEDQEAVFEEFRQVGTADKKVEGTGLGLALSRKFVELHGGRIWVKSELGHGSTFTFTLPVRQGE